MRNQYVKPLILLIFLEKEDIVLDDSKFNWHLTGDTDTDYCDFFGFDGYIGSRN